MNDDNDARHARLLNLVAGLGPAVEAYLSENAEFDVAYIILAAPAGVRHKTQAFSTNIATNEAASGLLANALTWLSEQEAKCKH